MGNTPLIYSEGNEASSRRGFLGLAAYSVPLKQARGDVVCAAARSQLKNLVLVSVIPLIIYVHQSTCLITVQLGQILNKFS